MRIAPIVLLTALAVPTGVRAQAGSYEQLQAFSGVLNHVRLNYVDSVAYPELVRASIDGMLRALDPHSYFTSRADWLRLSALERGELAETGLQLDDVDRAVVVLGVVPGSPAEKAGILPGDRLVAVDDTVITGRRSSDLRLRLAGEKGSRVRLRLERGSVLAPDTFSVKVKREFTEVSPVTPGLLLPDGRTGWVRLYAFEDRAAEDLRTEIKRLRKAGASRLVLDLRQNPGGLVHEAVDIAALFLPKNTLVFSTKGRKRAVDEEFRTKADGEFRALPLVLLVDAGSASASEALAGSLQDHDRARIVGRRTFGKALMQTPFIVTPTNDVVWLTVGRVITPSGRVIQRRYRGLGEEQYRSLAGQGGAAADTSEVFKTDNGRPVRGGGGIQPDVEVAKPPDLPAWWSVATDSGFILAVADSAALLLAADSTARQRWVTSPAQWEVLTTVLVGRVQARFGSVPDPAPAARARISRILGRRAAVVRWPERGAAAFDAANDADLHAALTEFGP